MPRCCTLLIILRICSSPQGVRYKDYCFVCPDVIQVIQGVNSIDINFGPKMGPKCQLEKWQIGRWRPASPPRQKWPEVWPENWPDIFYVN